MTHIILVRQQGQIAEADKEAARRVLFGLIDGLGEADKKSWRRLMNWFLNKAEAGEMAHLKTQRERVGVDHRRHMLLEQRVYEAQERFTVFDRGFRDWLKVGAGFCDWVEGAEGVPIPFPKSISYDECEQEEFDRFHDAAVAFLRTEYAQHTLWPHLSTMQADSYMEMILAELKQ